MEYIKRFSIALVISFVISLILIFVASVIMTYTNIEDSMMLTFVFVSVIVSTLVGSTLLLRKIKTKGLIFGGLFGLIFMMAIYLVTVGCFTGFFVSQTMLIYFGMSIVSGMIGGIIGVNL